MRTCAVLPRFGSRSDPDWVHIEWAIGMLRRRGNRAKRTHRLCVMERYAVMFAVVTKQSVYSIRTKVAPKRTAKVFLPTFLSVSLSRRLLTTKMAVEINPDAKPANIASVESWRLCTYSVPATATGPKNTSTKHRPIPYTPVVWVLLYIESQIYWRRSQHQ